MRISITLKGKATTISVDDTLMDYLGAYLVAEKSKLHKNAKRQQEWAKQYIRGEILTRPDVPGKDLSQYVQRHIIHAIAAPGLADIIEARGARYRTQPVDAASLFTSPAEFARAQAEAERMAAMPMEHQPKEQRAAQREIKRTEAAIKAVTAPGAKISHGDLMRAGAAILSRPSVLLSGR